MEDFVLDIVIDQGPRARVGAAADRAVHARRRDDARGPPRAARSAPASASSSASSSTTSPTSSTSRERSAGLLKIGIDPDAAEMVATRARGTPRLVNRFLRRLRDLAQVEKKDQIDLDLAKRGLERLGLDERGLCALDRKLLEVLGRDRAASRSGSRRSRSRSARTSARSRTSTSRSSSAKAT